MSLSGYVGKFWCTEQCVCIDASCTCQAVRINVRVHGQYVLVHDGSTNVDAPQCIALGAVWMSCWALPVSVWDGWGESTLRVCVCVCRSMMAGTVNTHRQLDTSSLRRENGAKRRTRCRTKTSKTANINLIDNILKKRIISTNLTKIEELFLNSMILLRFCLLSCAKSTSVVKRGI